MGTSHDLDLGPFLNNEFGDRYLYAVNHDVFNAMGSKDVYRHRFGELFSAPNSLFVVIGSDSGLLLNYLNGLALSVGSQVLVLELPGVLARLSEVVDLDGLNEKISFVSCESWEAQLDLLDFPPYVYSGRIEVVKSLAVAESHFAPYGEMYWDIRGRIDHKIWRVRVELGAEVFVRCQLDNLAEDRHPAFCLKELFPGKTAVILAGGPSLDKALPWVCEHREKFVIIAVSRIARRLLEVGLTPHMVFTIDPQQVSFDVSKEMLQFGPEVVLVHADHANPALVGQWQGRRLYLGQRFPWDTELNEENYDVSGVASVTNAALVVAREMGFARIILCGLDLCFSKEGYTHASGSREHKAGPIIAQQALTVETNAGYPANTHHNFLMALEDLAGQAAGAVEDGCQLINMSSGAAKVDNIEYLPLEQIELPPSDSSIDAVIRQALPDDSVPTRRRDFDAVSSELKRVRFRLIKIKDLARKALEYNDGLFGRKGKKADFKYKIKMDKIEKRLNREFADIEPCVKRFGLCWFVKTVRPDPSAEWTDAEIEAVGRNYYETYISSSKALGELLDKAQQRVQSRLEELSETPDVTLLMHQWETDKMPGRAKLWLDRNKGIQLPDDIGERLELMAEKFHSLITQPLAVDKKASFDPEAVKSHAMLLHRNRALKDLKTLLAGLEPHQGLASAQDLKHLVAGYIAEIEGDSGQALEAYQPLIREEMHPLTEEALNRIGALSLESQNYDNALMAMECLVNISPVYQPKYAELLKLLGRFMEAADVYGDYLEKVPDDLSAMLELGRLYRDMNVKEAAGMAFRHVLEKDPENRDALALLKEIEQNDAD
jgi:tetratricopeptide (TPR) repeat protein/uncharacterized Rossmann fold enzyme